MISFENKNPTIIIIIRQFVLTSRVVLKRTTYYFWVYD